MPNKPIGNGVPWPAISLVFVFGAVAAGASSAQTAPVPPVELVRHDAQQRVDVLVDGAPFTSYIWPSQLKKPVLFPLRAASGVIVTRGFPLEPRRGEPVDHPHQVGLWFTHEDVNGLDFWNNSTAIPAAQAPKMGTIVHGAIRGAHSGAGEGTLDVTANWVSNEGKALVREDTRFVFRAAPGSRSIDRLTTLTALDDTVRFNDQKDGLLAMRVARWLEQRPEKAEVFTDSSGKGKAVRMLDATRPTGWYRSSEGLEGDAVWGTRARWVTLEGSLDGKPVTIAILDHPANPGFPTYWHARGYGLFAANPLGQRVFSHGTHSLNLQLAPGQSTTFRYRILILDSRVSSQQMERYFADFADSTRVTPPTDYERAPPPSL